MVTVQDALHNLRRGGHAILVGHLDDHLPHFRARKLHATGFTLHRGAPETRTRHVIRHKDEAIAPRDTHVDHAHDVEMLPPDPEHAPVNQAAAPQILLQPLADHNHLVAAQVVQRREQTPAHQAR